MSRPPAQPERPSVANAPCAAIRTILSTLHWPTRRPMLRTCTAWSHRVEPTDEDVRRVDRAIWPGGRSPRDGAVGARAVDHPLAAARRTAAARSHAPRCPALTEPSRIPPGRTGRHGGPPCSATSGRPVARPQAPGPVPHARGQPRRHLAAPAPGRRTARADLHQARPDHLERRGAVPARAGRRVQAVPRPGAGRAVRHVRTVVEDDLGCTLEDVFASFERTPLAAASIAQVHAATLRTGEEVVVKVQRPSVSTFVRKDLRVMAWLAPAPRRPHPGRRAGQPAGARRAVRRDDRRGARLPHGSGQHDRHRQPCCTTSARTATSCPARTRTLVTRRVLVMERLAGSTSTTSPA